jgi:demethylmenaquinone methyltransferase/2-methoxy-6-polyprenyl-1,4-benzoquinol methylase
MSVQPPRSLRELDVERHLGDPALRQAYVTPMFDLIAPRYDSFTRVFSFGMDRRWKSTLVSMAADAISSGARVVDVACGTGDLAYALAAARPDLRVTATDVSMRMLSLAVGRAPRHAAARVAVSGADLSALPFGPASLDAVTAGYALRNTPDWQVTVHELARVIRPGGHLFTLDFFIPPSAAWRAAFLAWLSVAGRAVGWWWHREPMAYGYIARSIAHFATAHELTGALERAGFRVVATHRRLAGGIALHHAVRR